MSASGHAVVPPSARPLPRWRADFLWLRTIVESAAHRLLKRRERHGDQVASDYDGGEWAQQKAARHWTVAPSVADYADKSWVRRDIVAEMDSQLWSVPAPDYYAYRRAQLIGILSEFDLGADSLIELGSGTGSNLFALSTAQRWAHLLGLELSTTGREVARTVAERYGLANEIHFDHIDLLDPASPGFEKVRGAVCFTHYCLEQLPSHTEQVFRNLLQAGVRRTVMIEPTFELLGWSLKDAASRAYVLRQDYQRSIVQVANKLQDEGLLRIVALRRLGFVSSWRNPPTLLVWEPATAA